MNNLDFITIALFSVGVLMTGAAFSRTGKDMKSFFAGGGNVPWGMSGLSLFMGFFSAGTFVVWGSLAYSYGLVSVVIQLGMAVAGFVVGSFIAPRWHQTRCLTAAEYITDRFGIHTQKVYTYIFLAVSVFTTGSFLYPVAKILEVSAGIPLSYAILGLGVFSMIYVAIGGLRGVVVTDVLQFVILFAAVVIVVPLAFDKIGGIDQLIEKAPEGFFNFSEGEYTPGFLIAFCIYNIFFLGGNWAYVQRYTSVAEKKGARKVGWLFGALYLISPLLWMLPPMIYRIYDPSLLGLHNEDAYLLMCKEAMPDGLLGLMLGGMIFATASSLNATLNISAGVFTNDIFRRLRPQSTDVLLMRVARVSTLGFGVLAVFVALMIQHMGGIVNVVISVGALTGVPIYLPIIWSLFSKRQNARTLLSVTFVSLAINLIFKFVTPLAGLELTREWEMLVGSFVPIFLLILSELYLTHKQYEDPHFVGYLKKVEKEKASITEQTDEDKLVQVKSNRFTQRILGVSISAAGVLITVLGVIADESNVAPIIVGCVVLSLGLFLAYRGTRVATIK